MCGRKASSEAAIHAMKELSEMEQSEAIPLFDAANAFNSVNRYYPQPTKSWLIVKQEKVQL